MKLKNLETLKFNCNKVKCKIKKLNKSLKI